MTTPELFDPLRDTNENLINLRRTRAGRRPSPVWMYFSVVRTEQNKTHAKCNFCERRCAGVASRMMQHIIKKCPLAPEESIQALVRAYEEEERRPEKRQRSHYDPSIETSLSTDSHFGRLTPDTLSYTIKERDGTQGDTQGERDIRVKQKLVLACLRHHVSFELFDDPYFHDALSLLQPNFHSITTNQVQSIILKDLKQIVQDETNKWMEKSINFTILECQNQWIGVTNENQFILLEDLNLISIPTTSVIGICCKTIKNIEQVQQTVSRTCTLIGTCMMHHTWYLLGILMKNISFLSTTLTTASNYVQDDGDVFENVKRLLLVQNKDQVSVSFYQQLQATDALLSPFSWIFKLGRNVASSVFLLVWIWLLHLINTLQVVNKNVKMEITNRLIQFLQTHIQDHQMVALLLDPRVHGAGLSVTGNRKIKALVVQVATRIWTNSSIYDIEEQQRLRETLLDQLSHYIEKTGPFADQVVWEMSRIKAPEYFWKEYQEDVRELSQIAIAVLTYVPFTTLDTNPSSSTEFEIQKILYHYDEKRSNSLPSDIKSCTNQLINKALATQSDSIDSSVAQFHGADIDGLWFASCDGNVMERAIKQIIPMDLLQYNGSVQI